MPPAYDHAGISIYHGENIPILGSLRDASFDSVISDPPYGTSEESRAKNSGYTDGKWAVFGHDWDQEMPLEWLEHAARLLRPGGSLVTFVDNKSVTVVWEALEKAGLHPLNTIIWHKTNPPTNPRKNFCSSVESAIFARKPGKIIHWGGGGTTHNFYQCAKVSPSRRAHPTQKPVRLMEWLVRLTTPAQGRVLDPFLGGGSTLRAAKNMLCEGVGIEREEKYVAASIGRIGQEVMPFLRYDDEEDGDGEPINEHYARDQDCSPGWATASVEETGV